MSDENGNKLHKLYDRKVGSPPARPLSLSRSLDVEKTVCADEKIHAGITSYLNLVSAMMRFMGLVSTFIAHQIKGSQQTIIRAGV